MLSLYLNMVETEEERDLVTELYNKYERLMYSVAFGILHNKHDAEDAVSEAFIRIIKNIKKISVVDCPKTKGFAVIIVKNVAIDLYNSGKKHIREDIDFIPEPESDSAEKIVFDNYDFEQLNTAFNKLPEQHKEILLLKLKYDMSISEISEALGVTYEIAQKRIYRAKLYLNKLIEEDK